VNGGAPDEPRPAAAPDGGAGSRVEPRPAAAPGGGARSRVATVACALATVVLLAGPAVVGFARGGYFPVARLWAALAASVLAAVAAVAAPRALPRSAAGRAAVAGLAGLLAWTLISRSWAPQAGPAIADAQRLALYLATLVAAAALLREPRARAVEPALAAGALLVVAYGLSERLAPGLVDLADSRSARGRLEQPLTYWNSMGALAAMALVLAARLAGDTARPRALRMAAGALAAPLGAGLVLAFSRGAIAAAVIGLVVLLALAPTPAQLRAALAVAATAAVSAVLAAALPAVRTLEGSGRESQGLVLLAGLLVLGAVGAAAAGRISPDARRLGGIRPAAVAVGVVVALALVVGAAAVEGGAQTGSPRDGATAARLGSADSNRYAYWRVALSGFVDAPLRGHGAGSFGSLWLRDRTVPEVVRDAHSIWLETAAELGLVGIALLAALFGGVIASTVAARRRSPALVAGPAAVLAAWTAHSALDWDWEMPGGPTLGALVLAGLVIALADEDPLRVDLG